jgi:hypothetical protein
MAQTIVSTVQIQSRRMVLVLSITVVLPIWVDNQDIRSNWRRQLSSIRRLQISAQFASPYVDREKWG